jgi:phosphoribosyl 1,2-cyclic phosphodiesterase
VADVAYPIKICSLYSGSKGNSILVRSERARILVDAGKSARALVSALESIGESIENIDAIFITHEHTDHVSALATLSKRYHIPIHATSGCVRALDRKYDGLFDCLVEHPVVFEETVGDITVSSFRTSHDAASPVGYKFSTEDGFSAGIMTDTGIVTVAAAKALSGCRAVVLEANHDLEMLQNGIYPDHLKARIAGKFGHLSNEVSARFAAHLADNGTRHFLLAHLSEDNNTPSLAQKTVELALDGKEYTLAVAHQHATAILI